MDTEPDQPEDVPAMPEDAAAAPQAVTPLTVTREASGFRLRGEAMTRLETFTDAAFAFAVTLLVISIDDIPGNVAELKAAFLRAPAFALSFIQMMMFWLAHRRWSRRFGLEDAASTLLSFVLVILVLVYVYPLKIMFAGFLHWLTDGALPASFTIRSIDDVAWIFIIYSSGFSALCMVIVLLNLHALRCRARLALDRLEVFATRSEIGAWCILAGVGLVSLAVAGLAPGSARGHAGWAYFSLPFLMPLFARLVGSRRRLLESGEAVA